MDTLGNWSAGEGDVSVERFLDADGDGVYDEPDDTMLATIHHNSNALNQIASRVTGDDSGTGPPVDFAYDQAGNLIFDGRQYGGRRGGRSSIAHGLSFQIWINVASTNNAKEASMKKHSFVLHAALTMAFCVPAFGQRPVVHVAPDTGEEPVARPFDSGEIVPISFAVHSANEAGVFGVLLDLRTRSDDIRIHSVTFSPPFMEQTGGDEAAFPAAHYRCVGVQPRGELDRALGAMGGAVPLATVELEVMRDTGFTTALFVRARGALVGEVCEATVVHGAAPRPGARFGRARIPICSSRPPALEPEVTPAFMPDSFEESSVIIELVPVGGATPATELSPNTSYEVHYEAIAGGVTGYVLFGVAEVPEQTPSGAAAPDDSLGASGGDFTVHDPGALAGHPMPAYGYPEGYYRYTAISASLWEGADSPYAEAQGQLCNITTGSPGELNLHLYIWWADELHSSLVQMETKAAFIVMDE